jgi:hypothetical protein
MGRKVEITLEAFGDKKLTAVLDPQDIKGKNVEEIINHLIQRNWEGEEKQTLAAIQSELRANGGYTPTIGIGGVHEPVKFQPVRLGENIEKYVQDMGLPEDQVRIAVTGDHDVGYSN